MKSVNFSKINDKAEIIFKCLLLIYSFLGCCCLTNGNKIISFVMWPTFIIGALILIYRVLNWHNYMNNFVMILILFYIAGILSLLFNLEYLSKRNIVYQILWSFYFFILFANPKNKRLQDFKKEFNIIKLLFIIITEVLVILSLVMLYNKTSINTYINDYNLLGGFISNRLYGAFINPNIGSLITIISSLFIVDFMKKNDFKRVFLVIALIINVIYIALSDSRSGLIIIFTVSLIFCFLKILINNKRNMKKISILFVSFLVAAGCFFTPILVKYTYNKCVVASVKSEEPANNIQDSNDEDANKTEAEEFIYKNEVKRHYDLSEDISNRRFSIWKSGIEIFLKKPVFGTTYDGFTPYAIKHLPNTYIVNNDYMNMKTFDNEFINILVSNGIVGIIILLIFVINVLVLFFKRIKYSIKSYPNEIAILLPSICGVIVSSLFASALFYYSSPATIIFWLFLGYLIFILKAKGDEENYGTNN